MKQIIFMIILISGIILVSCNSNSGNPSVIAIDNIKIREIHVDVIDQKSVMGYLLGVNFDRSEVYVKGLIPEDRKYVIKVLDVHTGEEKNRILLPMGDSQSPRDFAAPSYIQFLDDKYFIFDGNFKIAVFDADFNHLYSNMFMHTRYLIDFYKQGEKVYFLFGKKMYLEKEYRCRTELYEVVRGRRPVLVKNLHECRHESAYTRNGKKYYHVGYFWTSSWGFEKDGNIFYANSGENKYYRYNTDSKEKTVFQLPFLKAKKYSTRDAEIMSQYKDTGWAKKMRRKVVYIPGPDSIFHFGLYDVGKNKIGIAAEIDTNAMTFRLDVLDQEKGSYKGSIRLPFGDSFILRNSTEDVGFYHSCFNLDSGIYIWCDLEGEGLDNTVKITKFKIKNRLE